MPWKETCTMELRRRFIEDWKRRELPIVRLCEAYGVSRKTAYKWIDRYELEGMAGLANESRAPNHSPQAISGDVAAALLAVRRRHPFWGPRKILAWVSRNCPELPRPAASTVGDLLKREGLVAERRRRKRMPVRTEPFAAIQAPNDTWCTDFKGQFRVGGGAYCYPLTITDAFSRFLVRCTGLRSTDTASAQRVFRDAFEEFGLPKVIRSDNGPPFGAPAGSLSRLAVWFIKLGIRPEYIAPASPQQNGRHERMHWTLKQETALPPRATWTSQLRAFSEFRWVYNFERPHEALGNDTPASWYTPSPRRLPKDLPDFEYPTSFEVRRVKLCGEISWLGRRVFISDVLVHESVGLQELEDGTWDVYIGPAAIGVMTEDGGYVRRTKPVWKEWRRSEVGEESAGAAPPHPCSADDLVSPESPV